MAPCTNRGYELQMVKRLCNSYPRFVQGAITARLQATDQENPPTPAAPNTGVCAKVRQR